MREKSAKYPLVHVQQEHDTGCVLACIAMMSDISYEEVYMALQEMDQKEKPTLGL